MVETAHTVSRRIGNKFPNKASFTYRKAVHNMLRTKEDMADKRATVDTVDRSRLNLFRILVTIFLIIQYLLRSFNNRIYETLTDYSIVIKSK